MVAKEDIVIGIGISGIRLLPSFLGNNVAAKCKETIHSSCLFCVHLIGTHVEGLMEGTMVEPYGME